jgi:hypothetical protein
MLLLISIKHTDIQFMQEIIQKDRNKHQIHAHSKSNFKNLINASKGMVIRADVSHDRFFIWSDRIDHIYLISSSKNLRL